MWRAFPPRLLLLTYRDVELSRQHPLAETLAELTRERLFERVVLRGLSELPESGRQCRASRTISLRSVTRGFEGLFND